MNRIKKRCKNPSCGCYFTPSKYRPDQEYCGGTGCKRYRDRLRQRLHYRRNIRNPKWREALIRRKKKERAARLNNPPPEFIKSTRTLSDIQLLLPGMIAFFGRARSKKEVLEITDKCHRFGSDFYRQRAITAKNIQRFPHSSCESEMKYSLRQF